MRHLSLYILIVVVLLTTSAHAAETTTQSQEPVTLEPITITATKRTTGQGYQHKHFLIVRCGPRQYQSRNPGGCGQAVPERAHEEHQFGQ